MAIAAIDYIGARFDCCPTIVELAAWIAFCGFRHEVGSERMPAQWFDVFAEEACLSCTQKMRVGSFNGVTGVTTFHLGEY